MKSRFHAGFVLLGPQAKLESVCNFAAHGSGLSTVSALAKETPSEIDCRGEELVIDP